jgi:hypothetical protein
MKTDADQLQVDYQNLKFSFANKLNTDLKPLADKATEAYQ